MDERTILYTIIANLIKKLNLTEIEFPENILKEETYLSVEVTETNSLIVKIHSSKDAKTLFH